MSAVIESSIKQAKKSKYVNICCDQVAWHFSFWEACQRMGYLYRYSTV